MAQNQATKGTDTIWGRILVGVAIAVIVGILGYLGGLFTAAPVAPTVDLAVEEEATVGLPTAISAAVSSDPEGGKLAFDWTINGELVASTRVAHCMEGTTPAALSCVFSSPGGYTVTVEGTSAASGLSSADTSTVEVERPQDYLGIVFRSSGDRARDEELATSLLHAVNWAAIQEDVAIPILLYDPEVRSAVYAALVDHDPGRATDVIQGQKVLLAGISGAAAKRVADALQIAGLSVATLPEDDAELALQAGAGDILIAPFATEAAALDAMLDPV